MAEEYYVDPVRAAFDAFKALPRDTPINMLNLLIFRDKAQYPDGHAKAGKDMSGAEAYADYGMESGPIFRRVGGSVIWRGNFENMLTGPLAGENWDAAFIARYPNAGAFLEMVTDPDYQVAVINRQAAVLNSRLVRFGENESQNDTFG